MEPLNPEVNAGSVSPAPPASRTSAGTRRGFAAPAIPVNEAERLRALHRHEVLDSPPEEAFDNLARVAATIMGTPVALVSLVDSDRQWFKARYGFAPTELPREHSFCGHVVAQGSTLLVSDAANDARFAGHPLVCGEPHLRFYAGAPLFCGDGFVLGALCAIDTRPHEPTHEQLASLELLARQVSLQLEQRRRLLAETRARQLECERADAHGEMLRVIDEVQRRWITGARTQELFDELLAQLLRLSGSEQGFLAELQPSNLGASTLELRALSDWPWSDTCRRFYARLQDPDHLFARVVETAEPVLADARQLARVALPPDHPPLRSFLALPFFEGRRLIGMVGLANRPEGYDPTLISFLEPFVSTCANLLAAHRLVQRRRASERALAEGEVRLRAIVDTAVDAIITVDAGGRIERANPAVARLFGYQPTELIGTPFTHLVGSLPFDPALRNEEGSRLPGELKTWVLGVSEEILGTRSDGTCFPAEVAISQMWLGERRMFTAIIRDVTERRKIDALRSEFVSTVSHELRTPLTSIRGSLGLLAGGVAGELPSAAGQMVAIALNNCQRLSRLIDDLLDIEKIESGRLEFAQEPVVLPDLIADAIEVNAAFAQAHGTRFELVDPLNLAGVRVLADPGRLAQVLANLLSNAAKFSPPDQPVSVALTRTGPRVGTGSDRGLAGPMKTDSRLRVTVRDHGSGVPESLRDRIFQRFTQAVDDGTRKRRGTGLGLSIAKAIVERLGGAIGYHPAAGGGSCFWFELPEYRDPLDPT